MIALCSMACKLLRQWRSKCLLPLCEPCCFDAYGTLCQIADPRRPYRCYPVA